MARPVDQAVEWAAATSAMRRRHLDAMCLQYNIPPTAILDRIGVTRVRVEGAFYEPASDGMEMLLIASFEAPPRLPDGRWRVPNEVVDLLAFSPADPSRWWSRRGIVAALGEESLSDLSDAPVPVWRTPLAWLRSGTTGLCPIDPDPAAIRDVLLTCKFLAPEDLEHGRTLDRLNARHWNRVPVILVPESARGAA